jgi:hypothetical protein
MRAASRKNLPEIYGDAAEDQYRGIGSGMIEDAYHTIVAASFYPLCAARIVISCAKERVDPSSSLKWHQCCYA